MPLAGNFAGDLFEIKIRFAAPEEKRADRFDLGRSQRARHLVTRSRYPNVIDERQHPELLESRMRNGTPAFGGFESASADRPLLGFELTLEKDRPIQRLAPFVGQLLSVADGLELGQIMFVTRSVSAADPLLALVERVEVLPEIPASGCLHLGRQILDIRLDRSFGIVSRLLTVAEESTPLCQMIKCPAQQPPLITIFEIEWLGQGHVTVVIGVAIHIIVGSLPTEKLLVERILLCLTPCGELFVGQGRTEIVADKHLEQFDLSQPPPEIVTPQGAGIRPILNGRFFIVLVPRNPFLENLYAFVQQCISLIRLVENCPSQRIGTQIQTQYFCHMKKYISIKLHKFHSIPSFFRIFAL